jgi:hypothetical protein
MLKVGSSKSPYEQGYLPTGPIAPRPSLLIGSDLRRSIRTQYGVRSKTISNISARTPDDPHWLLGIVPTRDWVIRKHIGWGPARAEAIKSPV